METRPSTKPLDWSIETINGLPYPYVDEDGNMGAIGSTAAASLPAVGKGRSIRPASTKNGVKKLAYRCIMDLPYPCESCSRPLPEGRAVTLNSVLNGEIEVCETCFDTKFSKDYEITDVF